MLLVVGKKSVNMPLDLSSGQYKVFTYEEFVAEHFNKNAAPSTLHNLLYYHEKRGHILRIRRGLYCIVPKDITKSDCPMDPFLLASKMSKDAVLGYRTALDFFGKLHSVTNEFMYLSNARESKPFVFKDVKYLAVSIPTALKKIGQIDYDVQAVDREGHKVRVTGLERTFVDILDRPRLCGSWEEIWRSFEGIEYLNLDKVLEYTAFLNNGTTASKVGFFLEAQREPWMVPEEYLKKLERFIPQRPHYMERHHKTPQELVKRWNLIVPTSLINQEWEEPYADI